MSRYPIPKPAQNWSIYGFAVIAGCMKEISSVNPAIYKAQVVNPNNGLGLLLHKPASDITSYASAHYPELGYLDGLVQIEYFINSLPWIYETADTWGSFESFAINCTSGMQTETAHFLYQVGYSATRADATQKAADFYSTISGLRNAYSGVDPYQFKRLKWAYGNRQLTNDEITNNINILYAYSKGVLYKNLAWLYYRKKWWKGEI